jgi:hypothetical protein
MRVAARLSRGGHTGTAYAWLRANDYSASAACKVAYAIQESKPMKRDIVRQANYLTLQEESWPERVLDVLRRILVPGAARKPVLVPVPVRVPVVRRRG